MAGTAIDYRVVIKRDPPNTGAAFNRVPDITDSSTLYLSLYDSLWAFMSYSIGDLGIW